MSAVLPGATAIIRVSVGYRYAVAMAAAGRTPPCEIAHIMDLGTDGGPSSTPSCGGRGLIAATAGAISMALLACTVAPARDTTRHAAAKLTVADLMSGVDVGFGFDEDAPVEFRDAEGVVETLTRFGLTDRYRVRWAREDILKAAWERATLGALSGFGGALPGFVLIWKSLDGRRSRRPASEPTPERRRESRERLASLQERPTSAPQATATAAPVRVSANGPADSAPPRPDNPKPAGAGQIKPGTREDQKTAPARRGGAKRDYGRRV